MNNSIEDYPDKYELKQYLINETDQKNVVSINPYLILELLKLELLDLDFSNIEITIPSNDPLRALLHYNEKVVAIDSELREERKTFSILHEIAHYVLPTHFNRIFLCCESHMSIKTDMSNEKEANQLAADLIFHLLDKRANEYKLNSKNIKLIGNEYKASFEAVARRLVEKSMKKHMLVVYESFYNKHQKSSRVKYCIVSPLFKKHYHAQTIHDDNNKIANNLFEEKGRDISNSIIEETKIITPAEKTLTAKNEYFTNSYNVFRIITVK